MGIEATIVVPTFDHGPLLLRSVASALEQTVRDIEVFVIGDGVPDVTRRIVADLGARDARVRFFDHPKGPRHGETYRHGALAGARGRIVCYLSDDDLYLPDHVETMIGLLSDADFANALPLRADPAGEPHTGTIDLALAEHRRLILEVENRIPLSCGAHTMDLYRRLPHGWRTAPAETPTDLYMWRQILSLPGCRAASGFRPTVLHFPSPERLGATLEERAAELDSWVAGSRDPAWRERFVSELFPVKAGEAALLDAEWLRRLDELAAALGSAQAEARGLRALIGEEGPRAASSLRAALKWVPGLVPLVRWLRRRARAPAPPTVGESRANAS